MNYRSDLDGLRAVAVSGVVAHHLGAFLHGGFVGVDVFFVISGYLITSILLQHLDQGTFAFTDFYIRRLRRIGPALAVMLIVSTALAYLSLFPEELNHFAKSLVAALGSMSNIFFYTDSGYFSQDAASHPLLHTWSLSVEEQFYLFLPPALVFIHRYFPDRRKTIMTGIAAVSFIASVFLATSQRNAAFYLPHSRAWELLLGTMVALGCMPALPNRIVRELAAAAGLAMILYAMLFYTPATTFPGQGALLPCLGTVLVIAAGNSGTQLTAKLLGWRPVVMIGLISYSLYLWHWPIIVFARMWSPFPWRATQLLTLALSLLVAYLSWRYVEQPFRKRRDAASDRWLLKSGAVLAGSACVFSASVLALRGYEWRFSSPAIAAAAYLDNDSGHFRPGICFLSSEHRYDDFHHATCLSRVDGRKTYLLLGDSHAAHLWIGLSEALPAANVLQMTAAGCKPLMGSAKRREVRECQHLMREAYENLLPSQSVDHLLLAARWRTGDLPYLEQTMRWAKDKGLTVTLFGPTVEYTAPLPRLLAFAIDSADPRFVEEHRMDNTTLDVAMGKLAERFGARYVSLHQLLCDRNGCETTTENKVPLQFDYGHFTADGSRYTMRKLMAGQAPRDHLPAPGDYLSP